MREVACMFKRTSISRRVAAETLLRFCRGTISGEAEPDFEEEELPEFLLESLLKSQDAFFEKPKAPGDAEEVDFTLRRAGPILSGSRFSKVALGIGGKSSDGEKRGLSEPLR